MSYEGVRRVGKNAARRSALYLRQTESAVIISIRNALSCHVTGWDPQRFHPFVGGYDSQQKTPQLADNGCENCPMAPAPLTSPRKWAINR